MHIVVITVQNSQVIKKIGELNFDTNNTLQRTNMACWKYVEITSCEYTKTIIHLRLS